ncbi:MAG: hypothetical protein LBP33_07865 [Candidatus Adiutrix sp.]|jgi:hypothetical protein|nr:hypothetical protein [Candidatus Adiutrix sp.]
MRKMTVGLSPVLILLLIMTVACAALSSESSSLSMFTDVPLPPELSVDQKNSQVYEHSVGRVGLMRASGRIGRQALLSYYREAMIQNGWTRDSEFDNGDRHMLIFSKAPRSAAVSVEEGWINSDVEINVSARQ